MDPSSHLAIKAQTTQSCELCDQYDSEPRFECCSLLKYFTVHKDLGLFVL